MKVVIDDKTGAIASIKYAGAEHDLVDTKGGMGLNDYFYVEGRDPRSPKRNGQVKISVKEKGGLIASLLIESEAPGCNKLTREVRLMRIRDTIEIIDTIDKKNIYKQEAVHIAFPFNVPGGVMRMDIPFAVVQPEVDQLAGACKNYFTVQRWVDISNADYGVTWVTPDAPLVEVGAITNDPRSPVGWIRKLESSTTLYSYVMNNYWETNYKASQSGPHTFRYYIQPHAKFSAGQAARFAVGKGQPLIVVPCSPNRPGKKSLLTVSPANVIATALKPSDDGEGLILRLFNASGQKENVRVRLNDPGYETVLLSDLNERELSEVKRSIEMVPWEIVTLRISPR